MFREGSSGLWELTACGKLLTLSSSKLKQMAQNAKVNITGLTEKREVSSRPGLGPVSYTHLTLPTNREV